MVADIPSLALEVDKRARETADLTRELELLEVDRLDAVMRHIQWEGALAKLQVFATRLF